MDAARNIDRNAVKIALGAGFGEFQCHALQRPREARAEQRVDEQRLAVHQRRRERLDRVLPPFGHGGGIALQALAGAEQSEPHGPAGLRQQSGCDEAVAPVVAGSAEYRDGPGRPAPHDRLRDRAAGVLH